MPATHIGVCSLRIVVQGCYFAFQNQLRPSTLYFLEGPIGAITINATSKDSLEVVSPEGRPTSLLGTVEGPPVLPLQRVTQRHRAQARQTLLPPTRPSGDLGGGGARCVGGGAASLACPVFPTALWHSGGGSPASRVSLCRCCRHAAHIGRVRLVFGAAQATRSV